MGRLRNGVGVGISNIPTLSSRRPVAFSPLSLFADGSQGVWFDDSDMTTMFQNASGTIAAALEQPVGLQLDLSQNLALGSELVTNGNFNSGTTGWTGTSATLTNDAGRLKVTPTSAGGFAYQAITTVVGKWYQITFSVTNIDATNKYLFVGTGADANAQNYDSGALADGTYTAYFLATATTSYVKPYVLGSGKSALYDNITVKEFAGNHRYQATSANRPTLSARYNLLLATATLATQSITTVATSYTITFTGAGTVTLSGTFIGVFTAGTNTFTATAGTLTVTVVGSVLTADIRPTNQTVTLPAYQAVVTSSNYNTVGFPQYLRYATNQWFSTASVNFTATAQMSVFSGIRKLTAIEGMIIELSAVVSSNNGSFFLDEQSTLYQFASRGTVLASPNSAASYPSPETVTLSLLTNITAPSLIGNRNGTQIVSSVATQGAGNYGTYPLYFGTRGGTSLYFNGQEYQTIIVGRTLTSTEIANTETYVNSKTKAYA